MVVWRLVAIRLIYPTAVLVDRHDNLEHAVLTPSLTVLLRPVLAIVNPLIVSVCSLTVRSSERRWLVQQLGHQRVSMGMTSVEEASVAGSHHFQNQNIHLACNLDIPIQ